MTPYPAKLGFSSLSRCTIIKNNTGLFTKPKKLLILNPRIGVQFVVCLTTRLMGSTCLHFQYTPRKPRTYILVKNCADDSVISLFKTMLSIWIDDS